MHERLKQELINDKFYFSKSIYLIFAGLFIGAITLTQIIDFEVKTFALLISGFLILTGLLNNNKITVRVRGNQLMIEKYVFGKTLVKTYNLNEITNLKYNKHVKSNHYTSTSSIKIMGIDVTAESSKNYYYHNEVISFKYKNKVVEIGKWKKRFNGKKLYQALKKTN